MVTDGAANRDTGLSVILRLHDVQRLPFLEEALFSLAVQRIRRLQVVIAVQGESVPTAVVAACVARQPFDRDDLAVVRPGDTAVDAWHRIVVVPNPHQADLRARLLNAGIAQATERYLAFLDDDDVVYQAGHARLIVALQGGRAALAAGGTVRADMTRANGHWFARRKFDWVHGGHGARDLLHRNFLPLHSFVLDRSRIAAADLRFDESLTRLEDYDFLLRLASRYPFDLTLLDEPVCEYRLRAGVEHANPLAGRARHADPAWTHARRHIDALKRQLAPAFAALPRPPRNERPVNWWRALRSAQQHVGGWLPLARRVAGELRHHGARRLFHEARRLAQRR